MNPQVAVKKPYTNTIEAESWTEHQPTPVISENQVDNHSAWEAYLTQPSIEKATETPTRETQPIIEVDFIDVKKAPVTEVNETLTVDYQDFYQSPYQNVEVVTIEEKKAITIDIYKPLELVGWSVFEVGGMIGKAYKIARSKDIKDAATEGLKGLWSYFITGEALKKKDEKQAAKPAPTPPAPRPFAFMSGEQNSRIRQSAVQINQQMGSQNLSYRGVVNQATGEVYAYYQAQAEQAQTNEQKKAESRNNVIEMGTGKQGPGIPGMGKNAKKGQGPRLEMSLERQHSSKGATLTSALG